MSIVLDGTLGIQRDPSGDIANIIWFLYGLPVANCEPENVVFLNESFGRGSPQVLAFDYEGEEYVIYADWGAALERVCASEVRAFYQTYGYALISGLPPAGNTEAGEQARQWLVPVQYYNDYVTMSKRMANVS